MKRKNKTVSMHILVFIVLVFSFLLIAIKLSMVALNKTTDGIDLTAKEENRNTKTEIIKATRGSIFSIDGETLAETVNSYTVIAYLDSSRTEDPENPRHVVDKETTAEKLSPILGMTKEYILKLLNKEGYYQVELGPGGRGISELTKQEIEALNLPGIDFIESLKRYYPMSSVAAYTVGYAQTDESGDITGKMGIEYFYNDELKGKDGYTTTEKDAYGYTMKTIDQEDAESGSDIYLTIDSKIQMFLEEGIAKISKDNTMDWLTFSVVDGKTGAVVASASNPNFNLNTLNITNYLNPLTSYTYEPGSTMKIFSFLAAMENGVYDGSATYKSGTVKVDDATIKDFNNVGWGTITYDSGFAYSSNVAATYLALKMGRDKLSDYYTSLGFGQKTGITLPNEYKGSINFTYRSELATAAFGQGITTTPIQNLQALTILTNDGIELQPYIVEKIVDSETGEVTYQHERTELGQKATKEHVDKMLSLMHDVVYSGKTDAKFYKMDSITLVGKTGTAQIAGSNGKYLTGSHDYVRSFAGIFPYEDPQYIIYVSVKKYSGSYKNFAKMVTEVVDEIVKYKNLSDKIEKIDKTKTMTLKNYISKDVNDATKELNNNKIEVFTIGNGTKVINQYPTANKTILSGSKVFFITNGSEMTMPDITGWSSSEINAYCKFANLNCQITGTGKVKESSIKSGEKIDNKVKIEITLE